MNIKSVKKFSILLVLFSLFCNSFLFADKGKSVVAPEEETPSAPQGRIIVLVVDISQSIKGQLDAIIDGLCEEIVEKRLQSGDYCVVVPLGDSTNSDKADSFGVKFSNDKEKIQSYLHQIKSWMPSNLNTDIGAAMKKAFFYINMINEENNGDMYEPLVLFITDGEIYQSPNSKVPVVCTTPEKIFEDPVMSPSLNSYDNWWFLGIENEGVPLEHIKAIAQGVGAYPDRYETLNDMDQFGMLFDLWLSNIPDPAPKDIGNITFSNVKFDGKALSTKDSKYTVVSNKASKLSWIMKSSYQRNKVVMTFKSVTATFQEEATGKTTRFELVPESGNIEFAPKSQRDSTLNVSLPEILGKGKLKLDVKTELNTANRSSDDEIPEYLFYVDFKTPQAILLGKIIPPIIILVVIILLIIILKIIKANAPIKVRMEVVGKGKSKNVSFKVHAKKDFGSKPSAAFKLEGSNYAPIIGSLERTGKQSWKINQLDSSSFENEQGNLSAYKLGTGIKITLRDGSTVTIKFTKAR